MSEPSQAPLEIRLIGQFLPERTTLVFLHEGLGSMATWRDFPDRLCELTGLAGLLYSRPGYGRSATDGAAWSPDFMHTAAGHELASLLATHRIHRPLLIGHSDGASIALIHASRAVQPVEAVIAIAPHLFVEPITIEAIRALKARSSIDPRLLASLARHHDHPRAMFERWVDAWLSPAFAHWTIESDVARITCPVLAIQGEQDQYGTLGQIHRLAALAIDTRCVVLPDCRHSPHLEAPTSLLNACGDFIAQVSGAGSGPAR